MVKRGLAWCVVALMCGCSDPVAQARIDSLGADPGPYEPGPNHRAGQPCTWCHGDGPEEAFDLAGTVFLSPANLEPVRGALVRVFDAKGHQRSRYTTESGNFFFEEGALGLDFPLWVKVESGDEVRLMHTPVFRERSCAACHRDPTSAASPGHVYLREQP